MFSRTSSGIRNTDLFYRNQYIVIVEGQDDVPFWSIFFPKEVSGYKCKLKPVGGSEIQNYVDEIYAGNAKFLVALDSDYRLFMGKVHNHAQIIETFFYSIENIIINPQTLATIICVETRKDEYGTEAAESWFNHFDETVYDLMVADYFIQKECLGKECLGKSCLRFLENSKTKFPKFSSKKISGFIENLGLDKSKFELLRNELTMHKPSQHIRGHFFFGASLCFINHEVNRLRPNKVKRSIANEDLYTMLILACKDLVSSCSDLSKISEKAVHVAQQLVDQLSNPEV